MYREETPTKMQNEGTHHLNEWSNLLRWL